LLKSLPRQTVRRFRPLNLNGYGPDDPALADGDPPDADVDRLLQGSHVSPVTGLRVLQHRDDAGNRAWLALYYVSPDDERRIRARMARRGPVRRGRGGEPCSDEGGEETTCPSVYVARVSIPREGLPVVEAIEELANDVCGVEARFATRDLDADGADELYARLDWSTTPRCPIGASYQHVEDIFDVDTLRQAFSVDLGGFSGYDCFSQSAGHRVVRDLNEDGHPDFVIRRREEHMDGEEGRCRARFVAEEWLYVPSEDAWRIRPPVAAD
jgi:hypothetical protein